jgi:hypothetical protein
MTAAITPRDEAAAVTTNGYRYDRVVEITGHIVRARIERTLSVHHSLAHVEMINDQKSWTHLAQDAARNWWDTTPPPRNHVDPATVLGPVADQLLRRAATILTPTPTPPPRTLSPQVLHAVSALLATTYGYDGERRINPDEIEWATTRAGALHIIEHDEGSVTFTKRHRHDCVFITSTGAQDCPDDGCLSENPDATGRRPGT